MSTCKTEAGTRAYLALVRTAEKIAARAYRAGLYKVQRGRRGQVTGGYSITAEHRDVVEAAGKVCAGKITPEEAMGLLHTYDVTKARFGGYSKTHRKSQRKER